MVVLEVGKLNAHQSPTYCTYLYAHCIKKYYCDDDSFVAYTSPPDHLCGVSAGQHSSQ
jgi:hypothetical protein